MDLLEKKKNLMMLTCCYITGSAPNLGSNEKTTVITEHINLQFQIQQREFQEKQHKLQTRD